jgi:hypothetical protein
VAPNPIDTLAAELKTRIHDTSVVNWNSFIARISSQFAEPAIANEMWFVRQVAKCRLSYLIALDEMRRGAYFDAWCGFERLELDLRDILKNPVYNVEFFAVPQLTRTVERWQSIFPYRLFASPEMVIKAEDCSICSSPVDPWSDCGHEVGKLYEGQVCHRVVREMELLSISIVQDPVQKMAVLDPYSPNYDYLPLDFVLARLPHPFFEWRVDRTTASQPLSSLGLLADDEPCPCGSREVHGACCKGKQMIVLPHLEFWFGDFGDDARRDVEIVRHGDE